MQFVRFDGPDRSYKVISAAKYKGSVFDQIKALEQIPKNIRSVRTASGEAVPDYPEEAIRKLVINATLHRAYDAQNRPSLFYFYSEHVEILNPGGLFGGLTPGIPAVHRTLKANGNPPAEFCLGAGSFGVNLYPRKDEA